MGVPKYANGFEVTLHPQLIEEPLKWQKPRVVFVNSMSDMFHEKVPLEYLKQIFEVMAKAEQHTFQILTKRSKRLKRMADKLDWPPNVWMGVTVESAEYRFRIKDLRSTGAAVRFLSLEPLLAPAGRLDLVGIDWVIVGGESGPGARPILRKWVVDIRRQCREQEVHFFFKQWGGVNKKKSGRLLDGRVYDQMPPYHVPESPQAELL
jgi:protein gp37